VFESFFFNQAVCDITLKSYCRAGQATDDVMSHARWMLDT